MKVLAKKVEEIDGVKYIECEVQQPDGTYEPAVFIRVKLPEGDHGKSIENMANDPECRLHLELESHEVSGRTEYTIMAMSAVK